MRFLLASWLVLIPALASAEPRLVSYGDGGLQLGDRKLYDKAVDGAAFDAAKELIWFRAAGTLYVLDLRETDGKPVAIATRLPDSGFGIDGFSKADYSTTYAGLYPIIVVGKSSKVKTGMGAYGGIWEDQDKDNKKAIKKIKITGKKWLAKQAKRLPKAGVKTAAVAQLSGTVVPLPEDAVSCDGAGVACGDTADFGDTTYQLIVTSSGCGDACHASCIFYDPKTKKFADPLAVKGTWTATIPADTGASCWPEDYGLRPGGEYFLGNARCKVAATGVTCALAEGWNHIGWVE